MRYVECVPFLVECRNCRLVAWMNESSETSRAKRGKKTPAPDWTRSAGERRGPTSEGEEYLCRGDKQNSNEIKKYDF